MDKEFDRHVEFLREQKQVDGRNSCFARFEFSEKTRCRSERFSHFILCQAPLLSHKAKPLTKAAIELFVVAFAVHFLSPFAH